jgi:beta-lactamase class D
MLLTTPRLLRGVSISIFLLAALTSACITRGGSVHPNSNYTKDSPHPLHPNASYKSFFEKEFESKKGCFVLIDSKTGAIKEQFGTESCREKYAPLSTFKIPLALMAFDSGYFVSSDQVITWDGKDYGSSAWNPHSAGWRV